MGIFIGGSLPNSIQNQISFALKSQIKICDTRACTWLSASEVSTAVLLVPLVSRLGNSSLVISELDHITYLNMFIFISKLLLVYEEYYTKIIYISCVHSPALSSVTTFMLSKAGDNEAGGL
jgi:hypothetical protein